MKYSLLHHVICKLPSSSRVCCKWKPLFLRENYRYTVTGTNYITNFAGYTTTGINNSKYHAKCTTNRPRYSRNYAKSSREKLDQLSCDPNKINNGNKIKPEFSDKGILDTTEKVIHKGDDKQVKVGSTSTSEPKVKASRVKEYAVKKYLGFIDRYLEKFEKRFEKKYPKAFKIYKLFKDGVRVFFQDSKSYYTVATGIWYKGQGYHHFTHKQLINYRQIPSDMFRVAPVLLISLLPFANYVVFPVAYMFPRHLLCRHFWSSEQKTEFNVYYLKSRLLHYPKVHNLLQKDSHKIKDDELRKIFHDILVKLDHDECPTVEEILATKPLFVTQPFGLDRMYRRHRVHMQWHVARSWNFAGRKSKMIESAQLLHATDIAMAKETLETWSLLDLQDACFYRGLNADGLSATEMIKFLNTWIQISKHITGDSLSLLLHLNILLTSTHPNNKKYLIKDIDVTKGVMKS